MVGDHEADDVSVVETDTYRVTLGPTVETTPDIWMPQWIEIVLFGFDEPDCRVRAELRNNIPRVVEIGWSAGPNSREVLPKDLPNAIPLHGIVDLYAAMIVWVDHHHRLVRGGFPADSLAARQARDFLIQRRTGKRYVDKALLKQVAKVYRANIGHAPTQAVARAFGVKHRQATNYVQQARKHKLLPPTKQGRAKA